MFAVVVCALLLTRAAANAAPPEDAVAADALLAITGDGFRIRRTEHFLIAHDTPPGLLRPLIGRLEGTFDSVRRYCTGLGLSVEAPTERMGVLLFDRDEDFQRYRAGAGVSAVSAAGFYDQRTNLSAFGNTLNTPQLEQLNARITAVQKRLTSHGRGRGGSRGNAKQRRELQRELSSLRGHRDTIVERFNRFVLQHEAAHHLLFNIGVHVRGAANPFWLAEGLACQFEVPQAHASQGLGRVNHMRLADFRDALGIPLGAKRLPDGALRDAKAAGRWVPVAGLIGDARWFARGGDGAVLAYAQAWGLVYYLNRTHRPAMRDYLETLATRKPGMAADRAREVEEFESHFGRADEDFEITWIASILALRLDRREAGR